MSLPVSQIEFLWKIGKSVLKKAWKSQSDLAEALVGNTFPSFFMPAPHHGCGLKMINQIKEVLKEKHYLNHAN